MRAFACLVVICTAACQSGESGGTGATIDAPAPTIDAPAGSADAAPCTPGPASVACTDAKTVSWCTEDTNFDGTKDGPPSTVHVTCKEFFKNAGAASCEPFSTSSPEGQCTMDDGGPCGVRLITGAITTARCTTDSAVCMLDLGVQNYVCTPGTGITCSATGTSFVPFCHGNQLVWRCSDDGDGTPQPHVDDCAALGSGTCDAVANKCVGIHQGGTCNTTEWICGAGLKCQSNKCVPQ